MTIPHGQADAPSEWVTRFAPEITASGAVLDLACGSGRHAAYLAAQGFSVTGVDRAPWLAAPAGVHFVLADLEAEPWPFGGQRFDGVIVTNYLHRPLMEALVDAVAEGGVLIYETFAIGNAQFGRPTRADFLLKPNELFEAVRGAFVVLAFEDITVGAPRPARVQRIAARRLRSGAPIG